MRIRRCSILFFEPREDTAFELGLLLAGGDGLTRTRRWVALAPHLGEEIEVGADERELLGALSPQEWTDARTLDAALQASLKRLLKTGLVIASTKAHAAHRVRDERLRDTHWHPLAATLHAFTRWNGADAVKNMQDSGTETAVSMRNVLGAPPVEAASREDAVGRVPLPRADRTGFDALLARRTTCRNFDASRPLPYALFAQLLERVFAAQSQVRVTDDTVVLKKNSPSGGGLHPVEAYLVVQNVEGVAPGLYHYHALEHALEALAMPACPRPNSLPQAGEGARQAHVRAQLGHAREALPPPASPHPNPLPQAGEGAKHVRPFSQAGEGSKHAGALSRAEEGDKYASALSTGAASSSQSQAEAGNERAAASGQAAQQRAAVGLLPPLAGEGWDGGALRDFVMQATAQQHWFADAHVLVVLVPRYARTFWKYRRHAKAYRVIALEAGHLSQNLYLAATEAGLGAFITGAINEVFLEQAFGLDPICEGALAVCGFGWRADDMVTTEFDPAGAVWQEA